MQKQSLGKTKNNMNVFYDKDNSHAVTHFAHHPKLRPAVEKVISTLEIIDDMVRIERDMGEIVGVCNLIRTNNKDEIVYAKRHLRTAYTRFVKNHPPAPTSWIVLDLRRESVDEYRLYTAFVGRLTPSFPGGDYLPEQSKKFWSEHALTYDEQDIVPGTESKDCPW